jgi:hypothetical protein
VKSFLQRDQVNDVTWSKDSKYPLSAVGDGLLGEKLKLREAHTCDRTVVKVKLEWFSVLSVAPNCLRTPDSAHHVGLLWLRK